MRTSIVLLLACIAVAMIACTATHNLHLEYKYEAKPTPLFDAKAK